MTQGHAAATARAQDTARRVHGGEPDSPPGATYGGFVTRTIAFAIDAAVINLAALLVAVVVTLVFSVIPTSDDHKELVVVIGGVAFAIWAIGYFVTFWTTTGQTPGARVMQIRVVRADGTRLLPRHAFVRLLGCLLSAPLLAGYIPILFTERRRGLPDWMAGTVVEVAPD